MGTISLPVSSHVYRGRDELKQEQVFRHITKLRPRRPPPPHYQLILVQSLIPHYIRTLIINFASALLNILLHFI